MKKLHYILSIIVVMGLMACHHVSVPDSYTESNVVAPIYPTYQDVTVPINIAPLSFELVADKLPAPVKDMVARYSFGDEEIVCGGMKAQPDIDDWKSLTTKAKGKDGPGANLSRYSYRLTLSTHTSAIV